VAARRTEVVSDLRRATGVQHHGRTEPSATNAANARSPQHQRNLAVTNTANDDRKTFTRQGSLVRSQYRPPRFLIYIYIYIHLGFQPVTRDARQIWRRRQVCDYLVRRLDWEEPQPMTSYFDLKNVVAD
jgi:hypothetical protein